MALDPLIVQKLLKDVPEIKKFRIFLAEEALKINTLDGMEHMSSRDREIEVCGRIRAHSVLVSMLGGLLDVPESGGRPDPRDYMVEVGDIAP